MEKNNKTSSNFSICTKIRQVLATNLSFTTIHRLKQQNQEPKPPQQIKIVNIEGGNAGGTIPITFDYSMVNENASKIASPQVAISKRKGEPDTDQKLAQSEKIIGIERDDQQNINMKQKMIGEKYNGKPLKVGLVNLEKQGKKSLDIKDSFGEHIKSTDNRIGTVSNVGKGQNNHVQDEGKSFHKMENLNDRFSDFIMEARKRINTT